MSVLKEAPARIASDSLYAQYGPILKTTLPGPKAAAIIADDERIMSPSYTRCYPLVVKRGRGTRDDGACQRRRAPAQLDFGPAGLDHAVSPWSAAPAVAATVPPRRRSRVHAAPTSPVAG